MVETVGRDQWTGVFVVVGWGEKRVGKDPGDNTSLNVRSRDLSPPRPKFRTEIVNDRHM